MRNPALITGVASACGVGFVALVALSLGPKDTSDPVFSREIIEYEILDEGVVRYSYQGEPVPEKIAEDEIVPLRTESSYTVKVGEGESGTIYETHIYSGKAYVADGSAWHYREVATTTDETFAALTRRNPIAAFFIPEVHAADMFTYAGDGRVAAGFHSSFSNARNASSGTNASYSLSADGYVSSTEDSASVAFEVSRVFLPFNTSSIPTSATISNATLSIKALNKNDEDNDAQAYIAVVGESSQASHLTLATADFDNHGSTQLHDNAERKDITSISTSAYTVFTFNSSGIGIIKKSGESANCSTATTGLTCIALTEGHDQQNQSIINDVTSGVRFSMSETSGTSNDPYLSITYTAPVTISTDPASSVTPTTATLSATISDVGSGNASTCGFAWGTNSSLSGGDTATTTDSTCPGGTGFFTKGLTGLIASTAYYFRAYATNVDGTGYGSIQTFTSSDPVPPEMRLQGGVRLQGSRLLGL